MVAVLTTSFPLRADTPNGVFVEKLVNQLAQRLRTIVIVPESSETSEIDSSVPYQLSCFRYAPKKWQQLAHNPGGIPVALKQKPWLYGWVPLFLISMLLRCIRESRNVDLIHANWSVNGVVAGIAGLTCGVPVVTTVRGTDISSTKRSMVYRLFLHGCLRMNSQIITVSSKMHENLCRDFPLYRNKITTISNGVDDSALQLPLPIDGGQAYQIVAVGNLVVNKGTTLILEALALLNQPSIHLNIIGEGVEKERLINLAQELGIVAQVTFTGVLPHTEMDTVYRHADLFILASYSEGRPNVVLEAMASGVPVIASDIDGVSELISDDVNGLLFKPGDSQQLSDCISRLLVDFECRHRLAVAARNFILENQLLWTNTADRYVELYKYVVDKSLV